MGPLIRYYPPGDPVPLLTPLVFVGRGAFTARRLLLAAAPARLCVKPNHFATFCSKLDDCHSLTVLSLLVQKIFFWWNEILLLIIIEMKWNFLLLIIIKFCCWLLLKWNEILLLIIIKFCCWLFFTGGSKSKAQTWPVIQTWILGVDPNPNPVGFGLGLYKPDGDQITQQPWKQSWLG